MDEKVFEDTMDVLTNQSVDKEVKLLLILEMTYSADISINKAKELCMECGLFSEHWMTVDDRATKLMLQKYLLSELTLST